MTAISETKLFDPTTRLGAHIAQRLWTERVIWLTTVDAKGMPQPRPVRFVWHDGAFIIFSAPMSHKIRHIAWNAKVALNFDGGPSGEDVAVFLGEAQLKTGPFARAVMDAYLEKYAEDIIRRGFSPQTYINPDFVLIRVAPMKLRGA